MSTIILDCDGVLLNWRDSFNQWCIENGFFKDYNSWPNWDYRYQPYIASDFAKIPGFDLTLGKLFAESYHIAKLPPLPGAVEAVHKMQAAGHTIKLISSFSNNYQSKKMREENLVNVFGEGVFQECVFLPFRSPKIDYLRAFNQQDHCVYVEDFEKHLDEAVEAGISSACCLLISNTFNHKHKPEYRRGGWDSTVKFILGE